jgi:hypothetical protein
VVVEQDDLRLQLRRQTFGGRGVGRLAHHLQLWLRAQQRDQAAAEQRVVVDDQHANRGRGRSDGGGGGVFIHG